jgi:hypothetical protein
MSISNEAYDDVVRVGIADECQTTDILTADIEASNTEGSLIQAGIDEGIDIAESMEQMVTALETIQDGSQFNELSSNLLYIGLNHMYKRAGFDNNIMQTVGLESWSESNEKTVSLESIKHTIGRIWEAIKKMLKNSIAWVSKHFVKVFSHAARVKKRADALKRAAQNIPGAPQVHDFDGGNLFLKLQCSGKVNPGAVDALNLETLTAKVLGQHSVDIEAITTAVESSDENYFAALCKVFEFQYPYMKDHVGKVDNPELFGYPHIEKMKLLRSDEMPGGKAIFTVRYERLVFDRGIREIADNFHNLGSKLGEFNPEAPDYEATNLPVLSKIDIGKIADAVDKMMGAVVNYKNSVDVINRFKARIIAKADSLGWDQEAEKDPNRAEFIKLKQKLIYMIPKLVDQPQSQYSVYIIKTCDALIDYCSKSLKQYS